MADMSLVDQKTQMSTDFIIKTSTGTPYASYSDEDIAKKRVKDARANGIGLRLFKVTKIEEEIPIE